jgi:hypothetical protein
VFEVGGNIDGEGGACDGFGFVELTAEPLSTLVSQIAAGVGLIALIGLLALAFNRYRDAEVVPDRREVADETGAEVVDEGAAGPDDSSAEVAAGAAATGGAMASGDHERPLEPEEEVAGSEEDDRDEPET